MMNVIKNITTIAGCMISAITLLGIIIKPVRKGFINWVKSKSNTNELENKLDALNKLLAEHLESDKASRKTSNLQTEALLCMLRDTITSMYYKYMGIGSIPSHARENLVKLYECYHAMNGNTYVDIIYAEMLELPVKN